MGSNDIECKYMSMFPLNNLARKGLTGNKPLSEPVMEYFIGTYGPLGIKELSLHYKITVQYFTIPFAYLLETG